MSLQLDYQQAHRERRKNFAARAVPDHGIELRNGWPVNRKPPPKITEPLLPKIQVRKPEDPTRPFTPFLPLIARVAAAYYSEFCGVPVSYYDVMGPSRFKVIVRVRHAAYYLARVVAHKSFPEIARKIGGRDHTTVMHGIEQTRARAVADFMCGAELASLECVLRRRCGGGV